MDVSRINEKEVRLWGEGRSFFDMMASVIFCAFAIEAKINFVGWKILKNGWPERASLSEKLELLMVVLPLKLNWGEEPLQTISKLKRFRNVLAHGMPEIVDETKIVDAEPELWNALKGQWEASLTQEFVDRCYDCVDSLWKSLLSAAGIEVHETLTHGGHTLRALFTE